MSAIEVNIADYMSHLSVERGLSENTLNSYRRVLSRYQTFLTEVGRKTPQAITETDIVDFGSYLKTGDENHPALGKSSVARALVTVRGFHKFLLRERTVTLDVSKAVKPPRPDARPWPKARPTAHDASRNSGGASHTSNPARASIPSCRC